MRRKTFNLLRFSGGETTASDPRLGRDIYQRRLDVLPWDGQYPVIGSWVVDGQFCGIGIREGGPITTNTSVFVPHVVGV